VICQNNGKTISVYKGSAKLKWKTITSDLFFSLKFILAKFV